MNIKFIISESQKEKLISRFLEQSSPTQQTTQTQQPQQQKREGTRVDGIIGEFTSKFVFPSAFMKYLSTGDVKNLGIEGNPELMKVADANKLTVEQMNQWNQFQNYLKSNNVAGISEMNKIQYSDKWWNSYLKQNPNFWVKTKDDVKKVQASMQLYRSFVLKDFVSCRKDTQGRVISSGIKVGGKEQDCRKPKDVQNVETNFMAWAKPATFKQ